LKFVNILEIADPLMTECLDNAFNDRDSCDAEWISGEAHEISMEKLIAKHESN
jgi:hypothetical protein